MRCDNDEYGGLEVVKLDVGLKMKYVKSSVGKGS